MGLFFQPIEGVKVDSPDGVVRFPGFELVDGARVLEYLSVSVGNLQTRADIELLLNPGESDTYIVVSTADSHTDGEAEQLEHQCLLCSSVLSIALWIHSDLRYTVHLRHEAYMVKGNSSCYIPTGRGSIRRRQEHASRGFMVYTVSVPYTVNQEYAVKTSQHPLFSALFALCAEPNRTEMMDRILGACRQLYFGYSAHFPEAQLIGAVSCIDALISTTPDERTSILLRFERGRFKEKMLSPNYLLKPLLGLQQLEKVVRFQNSSPSKESVFTAYDIRNNIVHNGATCTDIEACTAFRLAVRCLITVADAGRAFVLREDLVAKLLSSMDSSYLSGGALASSEFFDYPWIDSGMPDFLPFVVSRFFAEGDGHHKALTIESLAKSCRVITHQRDVTFEQAFLAVQQSQLLTNVEFSVEAVRERYSALQGDAEVLEQAASCRATSPLAWHELRVGPFDRFS